MAIPKRISVVIQKEKNQCGVACILMVLRYAGVKLSLPEISSKFNFKEEGVSAQRLIEVAKSYNVDAQLVKFKPRGLEELTLPCILHWGHNHFVVLKEIKKGRYIIHDPERGRLKLKSTELREKLTGFALEFVFRNSLSQVTKSDISLKNVIHSSSDVYKTLIKIAAATIFIQLITVLSPIFMQVLIDNSIKSTISESLYPLVACALLLLFLGNVLITFCRERMLLDYSTQASEQLGLETFVKLFEKPLEYFKKLESSEAVSKFLSIEPVRSFLTQTSIKVLVDGSAALLCVCVMWFYQPILAIVSIFFITLYLFWKMMSYGFVSDLNSTKVALTIASNSILTDNIASLQSQKIYDIERVKKEEWIRNFKHLTQSMRSSGQWAISNKMVYQLLFGADAIITLFLGLELYHQDKLTIGGLFAYSALKTQFSYAAIGLIDEYYKYKLLEPHLWNIKDLIGREESSVSVDENRSVRLRKWHTCTIGDRKFLDSDQQVPVIEIVNAGLSYEDGTSIFSELDLKVFQKDVIAIIGESGCGKSSLLNCIAGVQNLTSGRINFCGSTEVASNLSKYEFGTVLQNDKLLHGTILENISCFESEPDEDRVKDSLRLAGIMSEIEKLSYGVHSVIGGSLQNISSGQRIRLLLARAIYVRPKIFILDEPVSNVGSVKAKEIEENLLSLNAPIIYVSHQEFLDSNKTREIIFNKI